MKKKINYIILLFMILISISCISKHRSNIKLKTFLKEDKWGYEIYINEKPFIYQDFIPGIQGKVGFKSEKDAELVGNLVIKKIKQKKTPIVNAEELKQLGIKVVP